MAIIGRIMGLLCALTFLFAGLDVATKADCEQVALGAEKGNGTYECLTNEQVSLAHEIDIDTGILVPRAVGATLGLLIGLGGLTLALWPLPLLLYYRVFGNAAGVESERENISA